MTLITVTMKATDHQTRKTGRPLTFDRDDVLQKAMLAFWASGYETTSISELTGAMGITAPSLYATFGNKQQLFIEAMHRYVGDRAELERTMANATTARNAVTEMLRGAAMLYSGATTPPGCLLASAAATGSPGAVEVRDALARERAEVRAIITRRIEVDIAKGLLPRDTDATTLADLTLAVTQGMSVLARDGADRARLLAIARTATNGWSTSEP